jgi:hypothetical protein
VVGRCGEWGVELVIDMLQWLSDSACISQAMIAYPWNPLWAKLHTLEERQQLFKLLEKEAMSAYHQIKTRPYTWLEALSAGILIVIALFEIGKYHTVRVGVVG